MRARPGLATRRQCRLRRRASGRARRHPSARPCALQETAIGFEHARADAVGEPAPSCRRHRRRRACPDNRRSGRYGRRPGFRRRFAPTSVFRSWPCAGGIAMLAAAAQASNSDTVRIGERSLGRQRQLLADLGIVLVLEGDHRQRQARRRGRPASWPPPGLAYLPARFEIARGGGIEEGQRQQRRHCPDRCSGSGRNSAPPAADHVRRRRSAPTDRSRRPPPARRTWSPRGMFSACMLAQPASSRAVAAGRSAIIFKRMLLHIRIIGTTAAFGRDPGDVLRRILDVAGFAMHAILRIDLEPRPATASSTTS